MLSRERSPGRLQRQATNFLSGNCGGRNPPAPPRHPSHSRKRRLSKGSEAKFFSEYLEEKNYLREPSGRERMAGAREGAGGIP
jgi:hypothetical protein